MSAVRGPRPPDAATARTADREAPEAPAQAPAVLDLLEPAALREAGLQLPSGDVLQGVCDQAMELVWEGGVEDFEVPDRYDTLVTVVLLGQEVVWPMTLDQPEWIH